MSAPPSDAGAFRDQRRQRLRQAGTLHGLDRAVAAGASDDGRRWRIDLDFVGAVPHGLGPAHFRLRSPDGSVETALIVLTARHVGERGAEITVRCRDPELARTLAEEAGVFEVELVGVPVDRFFARAPFRFDGGSVGAAAPGQAAARLPAAAEIDYLAKDYESFKQLILDRIAVEVPEWRERNPADLGVTLVELLAYAGDYLSYRQDAVATEAYLDTARRRVSVRRHLRLVGYHLHEGSNARAWVQLDGHPGFASCDLPAGSRLLTHAGQLPTTETRSDEGSGFEIAGHQPTVVLYPSDDYDAAIAQGSLVFETLHPLKVDAALNELRLYTWGADRYTLPRGATSLALEGTHAGLQAGDVLILEEARDPLTGRPPGDPTHRHAIRLAAEPRCWVEGGEPVVDPATGKEIEPGEPLVDPAAREKSAITEIRFHEEDALPFPLTVAAVVGGKPLESLTVARGNVVLADHGETVQEWLPAPVEGGGVYAPRLTRRGLVWSQPYDHHEAMRRGASAALPQATDRTLPAVRLVEHADDETGAGELWRPRRDLLESPPFGQEFVVESDDDGSARLRFGNGELGRRPLPGTRFEASYRLGGGPGGQIGADSIAHLVEIVPDDRATRLRWLEEAAAEEDEETELLETLGDFLVDQPAASRDELVALWHRVLAYARESPRLGLAEAREAIAFVPKGELEDRLAALRAAARSEEPPRELPPEVAEQIARHPRCDLDGPERLLERVLGFAEATGRELSPTLARQVLDQTRGILRVRNPLPAVGGEAAEPVDRARLVGPRAFRRRRGCVTVKDWRELALRLPEVLDAVARHRTTGGWTSVVLHVHRGGDRPVDAAFRRRLRRELEPALLADRDLEIRAPRRLPLEVRLRVETDRGYVPEAVRRRILDRLGDGESASGERGLFHPDGLRFGQTLYLAEVLDEAMAVPGALAVWPLVFRPLGSPGGEPVRSRIEPGPLEIVTLRRRTGSALGGVRIEIVEAA